MKAIKGLAIALFSLALAQAAVAEQVATGVKSAENSIQTSNQRIFVSSDGALYEVTKDATGWHKITVPAKFKDGVTRACYYLGITETAGMVYTVCTPNFLDPFSPKYLLGLNIYSAPAQLYELGTLANMAAANGLTSDGNGALYAADPGLPLLPGKVMKITLAGPYTIGTQSILHQLVASKPNGIHYWGGKMYISTNPPSFVGLSQLLRYDVGSTGLYNPVVLFNSFSFLDDFTLVQGGAVLAEYLGTRIVHINESGAILHTASFSQPTSITLLTAAQFGTGSLLVTERDVGDVQRYANSWALQRRY